MSETDNNMQSPGVDNALKMRNTETSALKRMPVSANAASASSAARKTIKLKPLVSPSGSNSGIPPLAAQPAKAAPPTIQLNRKPAAPQADQAPKFMSTNTAPIVKMAKPDAEKPVQSNDLNSKPSAATVTKTVSIPRFQNRMPSAAAPAAPVSPSAPTVSSTTGAIPKIVRPAAAPAVPPISTTTGAMPKIVRPAAPVSPSAPTVSSTTGAMPKITRPAAAPAVPPISTTTGVVPKITRPATPGTVKPTYISTATTTVPKTPVPGNAPAPTITQGIEKQEAINQAKMQSGLQEAKPAIKLRPSAAPEQSPENLSPASPTIKLSPRTESAVSPMPSNTEGGNTDAAAPAKKGNVTVTTKLPRTKLQLKKTEAPTESGQPAPATPGAPTQLQPQQPPQPQQPQQAKLREQGDIANKLKLHREEEEVQTIAQADLPQEEKSEADSAKDKKSQANEPNIIFAICAILAFLVIGYTVFALTAQYLNTWEHKKIPVVGFEQIDKSMKK